MKKYGILDIFLDKRKGVLFIFAFVFVDVFVWVFVILGNGNEIVLPVVVDQFGVAVCDITHLQ